jgi:hypothetical protein
MAWLFSWSRSRPSLRKRRSQVTAGNRDSSSGRLARAARRGPTRNWMSRSPVSLRTSSLPDLGTLRTTTRQPDPGGSWTSVAGAAGSRGRNGTCAGDGFAGRLEPEVLLQDAHLALGRPADPNRVAAAGAGPLGQPLGQLDLERDLEVGAPSHPGQVLQLVGPGRHRLGRPVAEQVADEVGGVEEGRLPAPVGADQDDERPEPDLDVLQATIAEDLHRRDQPALLGHGCGHASAMGRRLPARSAGPAGTGERPEAAEATPSRSWFRTRP